jgi:hypothetical protein
VSKRGEKLNNGGIVEENSPGKKKKSSLSGSIAISVGDEDRKRLE